MTSSRSNPTFTFKAYAPAANQTNGPSMSDQQVDRGRPTGSVQATQNGPNCWLARPAGMAMACHGWPKVLASPAGQDSEHGQQPLLHSSDRWVRWCHERASTDLILGLCQVRTGGCKSVLQYSLPGR